MFFDLIPDEKVYTEHRPHLKITKPSFSAIITIHGSSVMCFVFSVIYFMTGQTRYTIDQWNHRPVKPKPPYYTSLLDCTGFSSIPCKLSQYFMWHDYSEKWSGHLSTTKRLRTFKYAVCLYKLWYKYKNQWNQNLCLIVLKKSHN